MNQHDKTRFDALVEWSRKHGAELHPSLEIYRDNVTGYSLRVNPSFTEPLGLGFVAVTCPLSTTLSFLNVLVDGPLDISSESSFSSLNTAFPPRFMQSLPPHVIARFFLIKEYLKGKQSFWWPYLATLPAPEQIAVWALPPFWPDDDVVYLDGTNAGIAIAEIQANIKKEFKQARKVLKEENWSGYSGYTQLLYKWAYSIFTSRSFRPSLILSPDTQRRVAMCLPEGCRIDDFSILQPLFDIANHSPTARHAWDIIATANGREEACRLICHDPYHPSEQVFNNYGPDKTNSELLLAYGFILPETDALHNDYVHVRRRGPATDADGDGGDSTSGQQQPKDFLISLRPITHPSSLAAHARLRLDAIASSLASSSALSSPLAMLPYFTHFEPALVDDLASTVALPEEQEVLRRWTSASKNADCADAIGLPQELAGMVDRVRGILAGKLRTDLLRLRSVRVDGDRDEGVERNNAEEGGVEHDEVVVLPAPGSRNQVLAAEYRRRCEKVLRCALEALKGDGTANGRYAAECS
ncbi:hypothetical protein VTJ49DRAFT_7382 [Mycothermus thermophilus]|uniref:SET domain-containing protein n=1 Tax=Humicola insolens TaxID=85995 RepID=A0ABR3VHY0_HUMIN